MIYLSELNIEAFRGIVDLKLKNLGEINIIAGINNSGKTSVLEAINLLERPLDMMNIVSIARRRGLLTERSPHLDSFMNLFNADKNNIILLLGKINNRNISLRIEGAIETKLLEPYELEAMKEEPNDLFEDGIYLYEKINQKNVFFSGFIEYVEDNSVTKKEVYISRMNKQLVLDKNEKENIKIKYISPLDHMIWLTPLNEVIEEGLKSEIIELLKVFDPEIKGLEIIKDIPYIEHNALRLMPLSTYGDGLKKVLLLAVSIIRAKGGILLIDEIETAIHVSALKDVFAWFVEACKRFKVQVFATTHSLEVIDAMLGCVKDDDDPLRIITLKKQDQKTLSRTLTGKEALDSREKFDMELR
jgi:AAA15 family ATPase/GTPase